MSDYYPPGCNPGPSQSETVRHKCPKCGLVWVATMFWELGGWFYDCDDNSRCPNCGEEGLLDE